MKSPLGKSTIILSLLLSSLIISCQKPTEKAKAEEEAIRTWFKQFMAATKAGDVEGVVALQADDVVYLPPNEPAVIGVKEARSWEQAAMNRFNMEEVLRISEIRISGDWAFTRGEYTFLASLKQGEGSFQDKGKFIDIFKHTANGPWRCVYSMWNSDSPSPGK